MITFINDFQLLNLPTTAIFSSEEKFKKHLKKHLPIYNELYKQGKYYKLLYQIILNKQSLELGSAFFKIIKQENNRVKKLYCSDYIDYKIVSIHPFTIKTLKTPRIYWK